MPVHPAIVSCLSHPCTNPVKPVGQLNQIDGREQGEPIDHVIRDGGGSYRSATPAGKNDLIWRQSRI